MCARAVYAPAPEALNQQMSAFDRAPRGGEQGHINFFNGDETLQVGQIS